MRKDFGEKR